MKKLIMITFLASQSLMLGFAQDAVSIKIKPEIGKTETYNLIMKTDIDGPQSLIMDIVMSMDMTATEVQDSVYSFESKYTRIRTDMDAGLMMVNYDSEKEPENPMEEMMAKQFQVLLDNSITTYMTEYGEVVDVNLPEGIENIFDSSNFLQSFSLSLPKHAITLGESWETQLGSNPFAASSSLKMTYREKNDDGYIIDIEGEFLNAENEVLGTTAGQYVLDGQTFMTNASKISTTVEVEGSKIISELSLTKEGY